MRRTLLLLSTMAFALLLAGGVAAATTFSNSSTITINDFGVATPYPSTIEVSGVSAFVQDVNLTLKGYSHTFPNDVGVLLVGPQGQTAHVMGDVGGGNPGVNNIDLTFDDEATGFLPDAPTTGSYKPTAGLNAFFPSPAPSMPYGEDLSVFDGTNPNGTWSLYVTDDTFTDIGSISGGWSLDISTTNKAWNCLDPNRVLPDVQVFTRDDKNAREAEGYVCTKVRKIHRG
jgi:large repetitive protein